MSQEEFTVKDFDDYWTGTNISFLSHKYGSLFRPTSQRKRNICIIIFNFLLTGTINLSIFDLQRLQGFKIISLCFIPRECPIPSGILPSLFDLFIYSFVILFIYYIVYHLFLKFHNKAPFNSFRSLYLFISFDIHPLC
jgi:hypothetical protein